MGFRSPFIQVEHAIEAVAVVALGKDIALRVRAQALRSAAARPGAPVPLIGRPSPGVRQAAVEQVRLTGVGGVKDMHFDPTEGAASFAVGDVAVTVVEEQGAVRKRRERPGVAGGVPLSDSGPCLVAELTWPLARSRPAPGRAALDGLRPRSFRPSMPG